jgi:DNA replication and repair protein RecF
VRLDRVELKDFRNHKLTKLDVPPKGVTVVVGPNGEGKTNLLEGIYFLFGLSSPRVSASTSLVRAGSQAAFSRGEIEGAEGRFLIEVEIPPQGATRVRSNRSPVRRKREVKRVVRAVFAGPDDLEVVKGDPSHRRRFLDEAIVGLWPLRDGLITAYDRALRQRNRALKDWDGRGKPPGLDAWDEQLIGTGVALLKARAEAAGALAPQASSAFEAIAGYALACTYQPNPDPPTEESFKARLETRRSDELVRRTSLVGPHRDDLALGVRDLAARGFASHGEALAAALCLRLGLARAVAGELGEPPVLLLDDPFSALDPDRRDRVVDQLNAWEGQAIITVADEADVPRGAVAIWDVRAGSVAPRKTA